MDARGVQRRGLLAQVTTACSEVESAHLLGPPLCLQVPTWKGWKARVLKNVKKARLGGHTRAPHVDITHGRPCRAAAKGCKPFAVIGRSG